MLLILSIIKINFILKMINENYQKYYTSIQNLIKIWNQHFLEEEYQRIFFEYIDLLQPQFGQNQIQKQIKLTMSGQSNFLLLSKGEQIRKDILKKLKSQILKSEGEEQNQFLYQIMISLDELRAANLFVAQNLLKIYTNFFKKANKRPKNRLFRDIFQKIDSDFNFLKSTFLKNYIYFTNIYDPFFLYHYEKVKQNSSDKHLYDMFNLPIEFFYKFLEAQNAIVNILCYKKPKLSTSFRIVDRLIKDEPRQKYLAENYIRQHKISKLNYKNQLSKPKSSFVKLVSQQKYQEPLYKQYPKIKTIRRYTMNDVIDDFSTRKHYNIHQHYKFHYPRLNFMEYLSEQNKINQTELLEWKRYKVKNHRFSNDNRFTKISIDKDYSYSPEYIYKQHMIQKSSKIDIDQSKEQNSPKKYSSHKPKVRFDTQNLFKQKEQNRRTTQNSASMNYKLKSCKVNIMEIQCYINSLNIHPYYKKIANLYKIQKSIYLHQYYLHKIFISEQLMVISLCCALPEGRIVIKYWLPLQSCDQNLSSILFIKYLNHLQSKSITPFIYYNGLQIKEINQNNFRKQNDRIYIKQRTIQPSIDKQDYSPFLTLIFSNLAISKQQPNQNLVFKENYGAEFKQGKFCSFNYLLMINKLIKQNSDYQFIQFYQIKNSFEAENKLLEAQINQNPYNINFKFSRANLMLMKIINYSFSSSFYANQNYIKFIGSEVFSDQASLITCFQLLKYNSKLYFAKGFKNINTVIQKIKTSKILQNELEMCVRMFRKKLQGKLFTINLKDQNCYGSLQIRFEWKDFLRGRVEQSMNDNITFGKTPFFCLLQIKKQIIFGFEVDYTNFI